MKNIRECFWTTILGLTLCVPAVRGQQPDPQSNPPVQPDLPLPAGDTGSKAPGETLTTPETESTTPDTRPLSGVELLTLGQMGKRRNFLLTSFHFTELGDTNPDLTSTPSNVEMTSTLLGEVALRRTWSHYEFRTEFRGGGILYARHSKLDTPLDDFRVEQRIKGRRWNFLLTDRLDYLPGSFFGYPGSGQSNLDTGLATLNALSQPNQSILTISTSQFSNTAVGQVDYLIGRKSSFTASASYGMLRSTQSGFVGNSNEFFLVGYNYSPNARNTFALTYGFSLFRFAAHSPRIYDHTLQVAYGYRITGRLALQLSGGPELYTFTNAVTTRPGWQHTWTQASALFYDLRRSTNLGITYVTSLSGGAGVLTGAQTHYVDLTVGQRLSRIWSSSLDAGFARNAALSQTTLPATTLDTFKTWYGIVTVRRPLGRYMNLSFNYSIQRQTSDTSLCTITICGSIPARHIFGLGFNWHPQRIPVG